MARLVALATALASAALAAQGAPASGGRYTFSGGTAAERSQVVRALDASAFPWDLIPATIVVHIGANPVSGSAPGAIWLDAGLLDSGRFSWGVVQHEFAHQIDFLLLDDHQRAELAQLLGGASWWRSATGAHGDLDCERFASSVAWAFWPSADNVLRPSTEQDEGGHVAPAVFRAALARILPGAVPNRPLAAVTLAAESRHATAAKHPRSNRRDT